MSEVDEDEANRMAEEERLRRENALLDEEEPMEEDDDRQVQKNQLEAQSHHQLPATNNNSTTTDMVSGQTSEVNEERTKMKARSQSDKVRREYLLAKEQVVTLQLKLRAEQEKTEKLERENSTVAANTQSNSLSRYDNGKAIHVRDINSSSWNATTSELYWRRCQKPCIFFLPNHKELRFQSPTQFARAMQLLKKHKELNKNDVMMLVQKRIPMLSELPTDEAWLILAQCPTLNLWVKEVHSWKETFDLQYAVTLQNCLGQDLLNAMEAMVFAFPGVDLRSVALVLKHVKLLKGEDTVVERIKKNLETRKVNVAVFIIPFSTSEQSKEAWQNSIDAIPKDIDLIVVFSHISQFDHSEGEVFVHLVKELYRLDGKITVLGPDFIVQFNLNRTLLNVADRSTCLKYWETVERIVKEGKIMWPHLKLDTTEPAVTPSETNTAESESSRGAGGPMRSQDTYRGRGNGPYTKFKNHR